MLLRLRMTVLAAICVSGGAVRGQERTVQATGGLRPADNRACVFAGRETHIRFSARGVRDMRMRVEWSLAAEGRRLSRGATDIDPKMDGDNQSFFDLRVIMPLLRADVSMSLELRTKCTLDGQERQFSRTLHLFAPDPFTSRAAQLALARVKLFDPGKKTAEVFDACAIPYTRLRSLASIDSVTEGIVIVGEGTSFGSHRTLTGSLMQAARRGLGVLCLAPSNASFPLSFGEEGTPVRPSRLDLQGADFVWRYDERFDTIGGGSRLLLEPRGRDVIVRAVADQPGWSWFRMQLPARDPDGPSGSLIVCGAPIIGNWEDSPVPRYLFLHLLEALTDHSSAPEEREHAHAHP